MLKLLKNRKGVTLVEVLAVIVILGIIAAIAVPTIGNLIENQRENAAESQWANIEDAARLYAIENSGTLTENTEGVAFTLDEVTNIDLSDVSVQVYAAEATLETTSTGGFEALIEFDSNGDLIDTALIIFINGYQVNPAVE
ncbi:type II secretion system GspH family protein [Mycoplasmatota bacterium]|nr:type II secretion system GspH family protein [Mycoplasmatota bacterium]